MRDVRTVTGTPNIRNFALGNANAGGAPIVVDNSSGSEAIYVLNAAGEVVQVAVSGDPFVAQAIRVIEDQYGDTVSVVNKKKDLLKFGRSTQVNSSNYATLMTLPTGTLNETYLSDNLITTVSSSVDTDTGAMVVEGHTISGSNLTFVTQSVTLTGQTQASLGTPLARCTRLYNNTGTSWTGAVYAYEDDTNNGSPGVPDTGAKVHCMIFAGQQQSEKASTSVSSTDYWIITQFTADVLEKTAAWIDAVLEHRQVGKVFRPIATMSANSGSQGRYEFRPYAIIPKNSDVRIRAKGSGNITASGTIDGILAVIV